MPAAATRTKQALCSGVSAISSTPGLVRTLVSGSSWWKAMKTEPCRIVRVDFYQFFRHQSEQAGAASSHRAVVVMLAPTTGDKDERVFCVRLFQRLYVVEH